MTRCVGHQSSHSADLADLRFVTSRSRTRHDVQVVQRAEIVHESVSRLLSSLTPCGDDAVVSFPVGHKTSSVEGLELVDLFLGLTYDLSLGFRYLHVGNTDRYSRQSRIVISGVLDVVEHQGCLCVAMSLEAGSYYLTECLLVTEEVHFE